jgi:hypothetical protein
MNMRKESEAIREALLKAAESEGAKAPFKLSGRDHEPRVTLDGRLAAVVRSIDLPKIYISGYGPNSYYPRRIFKRAAAALKRRLGYCPFAFASQGDSVYRSDPPAPTF